MQLRNLAVYGSMFLMSALPLLADDETSDTEKKKPSNVCINTRSESYFSPITDEYVFVENGRRNYLLTIRNGCFGLRRGYAIAFKGSSRRICSNSRAEIEYTDLRIAMPSCRIEAIDSVKDRNEASGIINERERAKKEAEKKKQDD